MRGAIADQVELADGDTRYTALVYADDYRDDPALAAITAAPGLVARGEGVFVYRASGRTARELAVVLAEDGGAGVRAALQLLVAAAGALAGQRHGNLSPWHVLVEAEGEVHLVGGGLPPIDVNDFLGDEELVPSNRTLRYCPPERLEGAEEDHSSDLYALALIAAEVACGMPVYAGKRHAVLDAAAAGDAGQLVRELDLPDDFVDLLRAMLAPYAEDRAPSQLWIDTAKAMASEATGPTLAEAVATAAEFLSVDEIELPDPFALPPLTAVEPEAHQAPPEPAPEPEPALDGPAQRARTSADALAGLLLAARLAVDTAVPPVAVALERAEAELAQAEAAATRAESSDGDEAEAAAVEAAAHLLTGEQLIDAIVDAQDAWHAEQIEVARGRIRAVVALTVAAGRTDLESTAKALLKHPEVLDPHRALCVAEEAEALVAPLLAERAKEDEALAKSLRQSAKRLDLPELLEPIEEASGAPFDDRRQRLQAIQAEIDRHRSARLGAAQQAIDKVLLDLAALEVEVEPIASTDDPILLESVLAELQGRAERATAASMEAAVASAEEALASVTELGQPLVTVEVQVDAARAATTPAEAQEAATAAQAAATALHEQVAADRWARAKEAFEAIAEEAEALELPVPPLPETTLAIKEATVTVRAAIDAAVGRLCHELGEELAALVERAAAHDIAPPDAAPDEIVSLREAIASLTTAIERAEAREAEALAQRRVELQAALADAGIDPDLPDDPKQAITEAEARLASHREASLEAARARLAEALMELAQTGDEGRIAAAEPHRTTAPNDLEALHQAAVEVEAACTQARADALATAQEAFDALVDDAKALDLPVPTVDPETLEALREASEALREAVEATRQSLLAQARTAAHDARVVVDEHGDAIQRQLAVAAYEQVQAASDHLSAQEPLQTLLNLAKQAQEARVDRARAAFEVAADAAHALGLAPPDCPDDVDAIEATTGQLEVLVAEETDRRIQAATERLTVALAALERPVELPDTLESLEAAADNAEAELHSAQQRQREEALAAHAALAQPAASLGLTIEPLPSDADIEAIRAATAQVESQIDSERQRRLDEGLARWAELALRAEELGLALGEPGTTYAEVEEALERSAPEVDAEAARRRVAALRRIEAASERLGEPPPHALDDLVALERSAEALEARAEAREAEELRRAAEALAAARLAYEQVLEEAREVGLEPSAPDDDVEQIHAAAAQLAQETRQRRRELMSAAGAELRKLVLQLQALGVPTDEVQRPVGATLEQLRALIHRATEALADAQANRHERAVARWDDVRARAASFGVPPIHPDGTDADDLDTASQATESAIVDHLEASLDDLGRRIEKARSYLEAHAPDRMVPALSVPSHPTAADIEALELATLDAEAAVDEAKQEALTEARQALAEAESLAGVNAPPHDAADIDAVREALAALQQSHPASRLQAAQEEWVARRAEAAELGLVDIEEPDATIASVEKALDQIERLISEELHADAVARRAPLLPLARQLALPIADLSEDGVQAQREVDALASAIDVTWRAVNVDRHAQLAAAAAAHGVALELPDPDGLPAEVATRLKQAEEALEAGRIERAHSQLATLQAEADDRDLGLQFAPGDGTPEVMEQAVLDAAQALREARLDAARAEADAASDRARVADLAPHTDDARAAAQQAHEVDDPNLAEEAAAQALASARAAEAVRMEEAVEATRVALARAQATGDPVGIEDATRALAAAQAAENLAEARAAEATARSAAARGAAPDLGQRRAELLAQLDAEAPRLAALQAVLSEVPQATGPESRDVRDRLVAADPSPDVAALRATIEGAQQQTELLHATQGLRDVLARLSRAEEVVPALAREMWLAMVVDEVASLWAVCHEASSAEGGQAPLRAADRALRTARAARARDDEGALHRAQRAAHDAADRARAVLAAEAERSSRGDLEDHDSMLLEEITESTRAMADEARRVVDMLEAAAPGESAQARTTAERVSEQSLVGTLTMDVTEATAARDKAAEAYRQLRRLADAHGLDSVDFDVEAPPEPQVEVAAEPEPPSTAPALPGVRQRPSRFTFEEPVLRQHDEFVGDDTDDFRFPIDDDASKDSRPRPVSRPDDDDTLQMEPAPLGAVDLPATVPFDDWADDDPGTAALVAEEEADSGPPVPAPDASWSPFEIEGEDDDALFADHGPLPPPDEDVEDGLETHAIDVIDLAPDLLGPGGDIPDTDVFDDPAEILAAAEAQIVLAPPAMEALAAPPADDDDDDDDDDEEEARTIQMRMPADLADLIREAAGDPPADPNATVLFQRPAQEPPPAALIDDDDDDDAREDEPTRRLSVASLRERLLRRKREQQARKMPPPPPDDYDPHAQTLLLTPEALAAMVEAADDEDDDEDEDSEEVEAKTTLFYRPGYDD